MWLFICPCSYGNTWQAVMVMGESSRMGLAHINLNLPRVVVILELKLWESDGDVSSSSPLWPRHTSSPHGWVKEGARPRKTQTMQTGSKQTCTKMNLPRCEAGSPWRLPIGLAGDRWPGWNPRLSRTNWNTQREKSVTRLRLQFDSTVSGEKRWSHQPPPPSTSVWQCNDP